MGGDRAVGLGPPWGWRGDAVWSGGSKGHFPKKTRLLRPVRAAGEAHLLSRDSVVGLPASPPHGDSQHFYSPLFPQPSTSSVTSDEKVDYVQVDKEKTQALQSTMQEWTDVRQSSEPSKGAKL